MLIFKLKTSDESVVNAYKTGRNILRIDHLIQYEDMVSIGTPVLLLFGGDGTPWTNGLYAIAKIASRPIDLGYEIARNGRYYKLDIEVVLRLNPIFEKRDFIKYPESFDSGVAPSTKGERNQALGVIDDGTPKTIASICRALLDSRRDYEPQLRALFGDRIIDYAFEHSIVFTEVKNQSELQQDEADVLLDDAADFQSEQIIYYGVPGSGKSFEIDRKIKKKIPEKRAREWRVSRVVFHPDYTNADFVGQIVPRLRVGGGVDYKFLPGPFSKILRRAYLNPHKDFYLIIEEINRGNASAIFGDLFQLLDRTDPGEDPKDPGFGENKYGVGWSNYSIDNQNICDYIRDIESFKSESTDDGVNPQHDPNIEPAEADSEGATSFVSLKIKLGEKKYLTISENTQIRLPPNLSLYATMNTSDQNVFTLDNAFQRRWDMKQVSNDLKNDNEHPDEKAQYDQLIGDTSVTWGAFREKINEIIMQSAEENGLSSMEDKRLGGWFVIPKKASDASEGAEATITSEAFAEKVLKYLWDDAFKFDRKSHFGDVKTLEELIEKFKVESFKVFSDEQISGLSQNGTASAQTGTSES